MSPSRLLSGAAALLLLLSCSGRQPGFSMLDRWARKPVLASCPVPVAGAYAILSRKWADGDVVELLLSMPVEEVAADPRVKEDVGKRAIQRGPIVYCLEETDNPEEFDSLRLTEDAQFDLTSLDKRQWWGHPLVQIQARTGGKTLTFLPYFAWDNREAGKMKVWIPIDVFTE